MQIMGRERLLFLSCNWKGIIIKIIKASLTQRWVIIFMDSGAMLTDSSVPRWFINAAFTALPLCSAEKLFGHLALSSPPKSLSEIILEYCGVHSVASY